jgi:hypothetical protein
MHLFDHIVKPVLPYRAEIWAPFVTKNKHSIDKIMQCGIDLTIEKCHLKFGRLTLGTIKKAPNLGIYGETGRTPLFSDFIGPIIKYLQRLKTSNSNSILHEAYSENLILWINNKDCWSKHIHDLFNTLKYQRITGDLTKIQLSKIITDRQFQYKAHFNPFSKGS